MNVTVIYWRNIPSQVVAKAGRKSAKVMLSDRFQEAIDMAAMRSKAHESEDYLEGWIKSDPEKTEGDQETIAKEKAAQLEAKFDGDVLAAYVKNDGWSPQ